MKPQEYLGRVGVWAMFDNVCIQILTDRTSLPIGQWRELAALV
jgi:hypothetical protein